MNFGPCIGAHTKLVSKCYFSKVGVHSTRLETESALRTNVACEYDILRILCFELSTSDLEHFTILTMFTWCLDGSIHNVHKKLIKFLSYLMEVAQDS